MQRNVKRLTAAAATILVNLKRRRVKRCAREHPRALSPSRRLSTVAHKTSKIGRDS